MMNRSLINSKISEWLKESYIDKLTYYITGWELSFVNMQTTVTSVFSEIKLLHPQNWDQLIEKSPINLIDTNEYEDTMTSVALFTVINKHTISRALIDESNNLIIEFENNVKILIPSKSEIEDVTWILSSKGESIECQWTKIIISEIEDI